MREQAGFLEDIPYATAVGWHGLMVILPYGVVEADTALQIRQAGDEPQKGRLSRPRWPPDGGDTVTRTCISKVDGLPANRI
jgi:hypothetical protein